MTKLVHKKSGMTYIEGIPTRCIGQAYYLNDYGGLPSIFDFKDSIVMDCGGNIGSFAKRALEDGASVVVSYEPHPALAEVCEINAPGAEVTPAAVGVSAGSFPFWWKLDTIDGSTLVKPSRNLKSWNEIEVEVLDFWKELDKLQPTIVKMDIEGPEWDILRAGVMPDCVKYLTVEFHKIGPKGLGTYDEAYDIIDRTFPDSNIVMDKQIRGAGLLCITNARL